MTRGAVGQPPEWYLVLKAADRLRCHPEEVERGSLAWFHRALVAAEAEAAAEKKSDYKKVM